MTPKQKEMLVRIMRKPLYCHPSRSPLDRHSMRTLNTLMYQGLVSARVVDLKGEMIDGMSRGQTSVYAITDVGRRVATSQKEDADYYVVVAVDGKPFIQSGWGAVASAAFHIRDQLPENVKAKVVAKNDAKRGGLDPDDNANWDAGPSSRWDRKD